MMGQQGKWSTNADLDAYINTGYDSSRGGAGTTQEFSFQDWALAQMASKMGKTDDADYFLKRSSGWKAHFHPEIGLIMPKRADGTKCIG